MIDDLRESIIYRSVVGSRAYGLERGGSDTDIRGCFLPPSRLHWSLAGVPEQLENAEAQECFWELGKFLKLGLRCNPTVLECLFSPLVIHAEPIAREMLDIRQAFLSVHAHGRYRSYATDQMRRLENGRHTTGEINWRHAMHTVRLLLCGLHLVQTGEVKVSVAEHRERLLAIRDGRIEWPEVKEQAEEFAARMDEAMATSPLPQEPDRGTVEAFLIRARKSAVDR